MLILLVITEKIEHIGGREVRAEAIVTTNIIKAEMMVVPPIIMIEDRADPRVVATIESNISRLGKGKGHLTIWKEEDLKLTLTRVVIVSMNQ